LFFAATFGSAQGATAPSTITSASNTANVPVVWLT
jgi:thiazole synthase ThiGH ThiG subunit